MTAHTVYRTFNTDDVAAALSPDPGDFRHHRVFYAEFDGGRDKRLVIRVLGE